MSKKMAQKSIEFGYAVALKDGLGVFAGVYYDRAIREADSVGLARHVMLGHTIAHEVGHLLLGPSSHVGSGIMSPHWGQREVHLAGMGSFLFTETQARTMRRQAAKRVQRAEDQWAQLHKNAPRAVGASEIAASR